MMYGARGSIVTTSTFAILCMCSAWKSPAQTTVQASPSVAPKVGVAIDASAVTDAKAKPVVEQIAKAVGAVREYACTIQHSSATPKGNLAMTEQFWCKRPWLLVVQKNVEHPAAVVRGNTTYLYSDGSTLIQHVAPGSGALQAYTEMFSKSGRMPAAQVQKLATDSAKPKANRIDLQKMRAAGIAVDGLFCQEWVVNPFVQCDMVTIKLEGETPGVWKLSAQMNLQAGKQKALIEIGKADCIVRSVEIDGANGKNKSTIQDVKINPSPGIPDTYFRYVPPAGLTLTDGTDELIKGLASQPATR